MVQRMVPAAKIARADKISKSPSAPPGERPPARSHLQAPGSRTCDKKHRTEHPACPKRSKRGPDAPFTLRPSVSPPRRTGPLPFRPYQSPPSARADARQHLSSIRPTPILAPSGRSTRSFPPAPVSAIYPKPRPSAPRRQPVFHAPAGIRTPSVPEMSENQHPNKKISTPHFAQSPFFVIFTPALSLINF